MKNSGEQKKKERQDKQGPTSSHQIRNAALKK
jgi:hypothetical protein